MESSRPDKSSLRKRASALPAVEGGEILTEREALSILEYVKELGSLLPEHLLEQVERVLGESFEQIEMLPGPISNTYHISETALRGLISRAVLAGAAQAASDFGEPLAQARHFYELFVYEQPDERSA